MNDDAMVRPSRHAQSCRSRGASRSPTAAEMHRWRSTWSMIVAVATGVRVSQHHDPHAVPGWFGEWDSTCSGPHRTPEQAVTALLEHSTTKARRADEEPGTSPGFSFSE